MGFCRSGLPALWQNIYCCCCIEQAQSIFWPDGVKGELNQALFLIGLVLLAYVNWFSLMSFRFLCCHLVVVIFVLLVAAD